MEKLQDTLLKNGLNVCAYSEPDEPGEIIQLELMQKIPISNINSQHIKSKSLLLGRYVVSHCFVIRVKNRKVLNSDFFALDSLAGFII